MTEARPEVKLTEAERTSLRIRMVRMNERCMAPVGPLAGLRRLSEREVRAIAQGDGEHAALAAAELDARLVAGLARTVGTAEAGMAPIMRGVARAMDDLAAAFSGVDMSEERRS